jgi:hypothetical protein
MGDNDYIGFFSANGAVGKIILEQCSVCGAHGMHRCREEITREIDAIIDGMRNRKIWPYDHD